MTSSLERILNACVNTFTLFMALPIRKLSVFSACIKLLHKPTKTIAGFLAIMLVFGSIENLNPAFTFEELKELEII